mgnify:CR=1 FL=1
MNEESKEPEEPDYNEEAYRAECEADKQPKGFPTRKTGICKKEPINLDEAKTELEEVKGEIKEIEESNLKDRFLGVVFIIMEKPSDCTYILDR